MTRGCNIPECPDLHCARGLCRRHYNAARENRRPLPKPRPAPEVDGQLSLGVVA